MKRAGYIVFLGLIVAAVGYTCTYLAGMKAQHHIEKSNQPALAWLQEEYHLNNAQLIRECQLQAAYQPKCTEMCRKIDAMNARLQNLIAATNTITPEIKQALAENAQLRASCEQMMLAHFYSVAQAMPPEEGKRYLAWVQKETLIPAPMSAKSHFNNPITTKPD